MEWITAKEARHLAKNNQEINKIMNSIIKSSVNGELSLTISFPCLSESKIWYIKQILSDYGYDFEISNKNYTGMLNQLTEFKINWK